MISGVPSYGLKKLDALGFDVKLKQIICDFELNILKSVDVMLKVPIHGCFFHFKQCIQRRVDRNGLKVTYENDSHFRKFINQSSALSFLPIEDIEIGLDYLDNKFVFDDARAHSFKLDFVKYMRDFWIHGCLPPRTWNTFGRYN